MLQIPVHNRHEHRGLPLSMNNKDDQSTDDTTRGLLSTFRERPGTLLVAPFVVIVALDLLANIAVLTKRSLEVLFTGQYTEWHF